MDKEQFIEHLATLWKYCKVKTVVRTAPNVVIDFGSDAVTFIARYIFHLDYWEFIKDEVIELSKNIK